MPQVASPRPAPRPKFTRLKAAWKNFREKFVFPSLPEPENAVKPSELSLNEFAKVREKLWSQRSGSTDKIDNIILTVSSSFLGLSITFLKDIVQPAPPSQPEILWWSWGAFTAAIAFVFVSHHSSYSACGYELKRNEVYFVRRIDQALTFSNGWQSVTQFFNILAALCFLAGIGLSADFVILNTQKKFNNVPTQPQRAESSAGTRPSNPRAGGGTGRHADGVFSPAAQRTASPNPTTGGSPSGAAK